MRSMRGGGRAIGSGCPADCPARGTWGEGAVWRLGCGGGGEGVRNQGDAMMARGEGVYGVMERKSKNKSCWEAREGALSRLPSSWTRI